MERWLRLTAGGNARRRLDRPADIEQSRVTFQHNELPNTGKHHFPLFSTSMNNQQGGGGYMSGGGQSGGFMSQAPPKEDMAYLCAGVC